MIEQAREYVSEYELRATTTTTKISEDKNSDSKQDVDYGLMDDEEYLHGVAKCE